MESGFRVEYPVIRSVDISNRPIQLLPSSAMSGPGITSTQGDHSLTRGKAVADQEGTRSTVQRHIPPKRISTRQTTVITSPELIRQTLTMDQAQVNPQQELAITRYPLINSKSCITPP
ncbi:hypothetical protein LIER_15842 [Lithospermum erythrorhizon]|uniref:Uncharacterized protein n=1 Tax=Lithospermum erythrorhizon TaxID=34254 RepID=A0AAV3Q705_LITER